MPPPYDIFWADEALEQLDLIIKYLESRWSKREIDHFLDDIKSQEMILAHNPKAYPLSNQSDGYRRCVFSKQTSIYYKFEEESVIIRFLFDNRRDPKSLNL